MDTPPVSPSEVVPKDLVEQLCAFGEDPGSIGSVWCGAGGWYARVLTPRPRVPLPASQSKGRTQATATKLSVPKPVNLPSMKKVTTPKPIVERKGRHEVFLFFFFFFQWPPAEPASRESPFASAAVVCGPEPARAPS